MTFLFILDFQFYITVCVRDNYSKIESHSFKFMLTNTFRFKIIHKIKYTNFKIKLSYLNRAFSIKISKE
jgi:hypothetical protein